MNKIKLKHHRYIEDDIDIGSCIKIRNSNKIFQIIGLNNKKTICWIREWPLHYGYYQTFAFPLNQVKLSIACPNILDRE